MSASERVRHAAVEGWTASPSPPPGPALRLRLHFIPFDAAAYFGQHAHFVPFLAACAFDFVPAACAGCASSGRISASEIAIQSPSITGNGDFAVYHGRLRPITTPSLVSLAALNSILAVRREEVLRGHLSARCKDLGRRSAPATF